MGGLVFQWLTSIGIGYAIPNFKERGITTAERLAALELQDYDLVGVTDTDHRKKLFILVQRVRLAFQEQSGGAWTTEERADAGQDTGGAENAQANEEGKEVDEARGPTGRTAEAVLRPDVLKRPAAEAKEGGDRPPVPPSLDEGEIDQKALDSYMKSIEDTRPPPPPPPRPVATSQATGHEGHTSPKPPSPRVRPTNDPPPQPQSQGHQRHHTSAAPLRRPSVDSARAHRHSADDVPLRKPSDRQSPPPLPSASSARQLPVERQLPTERHVSAERHMSAERHVSAERQEAVPPPPPPPIATPSLDSAGRPGQTRNRQRLLVDMIDGGEDRVPIRVVVRKRPLTSSERGRGDADIIETVAPNHVVVLEPKIKVDLSRVTETHSFAFDDTFSESSNNEQIYNKVCVPLVASMFRGGRSTCFAYGQTGSGKTFTMMGAGRAGGPEHCGLYELAAVDMFHVVSHSRFAQLSLLVSFYEIYGGKLFDLLNARSVVRCLEDGKQQVQFLGLSEHKVSSVDDLLRLIEDGQRMRSTGSTAANADSSRSHAILQISLRKQNPTPNQKGRAKPAPPFGTLSFIDLAGSERGADTRHSDKATRLEGAEINTSLLALKEVIRALDRKQLHTPFRGSKLTQVLKDSLVGANAKTVMIACIAPNISNCEHTLNTLRYADRVKEHDASRRAPAVAPTVLNNGGSRDMVGGLGSVDDHMMATGPSPLNLAHDVSPPSAPSNPTLPSSASAPSVLRTLSEDEIEMYAQELRELRRVTTTTGRGTRASSASSSIKPAWVGVGESEAKAGTQANTEGGAKGTGQKHQRHQRSQSLQQTQTKATHARRGSHSSLGGSEDGGARGKQGSGEGTRRKCDDSDKADNGREALARLVQHHRDVYSSLTVNLREEVDFLQVTDGNPSNMVPYMHQLDHVLSANAGLIERLKASLMTFKGSRARHQVVT